MSSVPASPLRVLRSSSDEPARSPELARLQSLFQTTLHHQIRTPLSGLMGMTDLLLETALTEEQRDYAITARQCAEELLHTLNETLQYVALEAGDVKLEASEFNVRELAESAIDLHSAKAQTKGVRLFSTLETGLPGTGLPATLVGDGHHIKEILGYLLDNALKFTEQGMIQLSVSYKDEALQLAVRDTGIGIAPQQREKILQSFRQADVAFPREQSGIGLGLLLANRLTELMQGRLSFESELSRGSIFTVEIPVCPPGVSTKDDATKDVEPRTFPALPLVLGVDDNPVGTAVLRHAMKNYPLTLHLAASGEQAVEFASRHRYSMILMDLQMPGMSGWDATAAIRRLPGYANVPILALTADVSDIGRHECISRGMQGFLTKPIQPESLWTSIASQLKIERS